MLHLSDESSCTESSRIVHVCGGRFEFFQGFALTTSKTVDKPDVFASRSVIMAIVFLQKSREFFISRMDVRFS